MKSSCQGFTLLEVLIALTISAIGLLGMASLTVATLQSQHSAYQHSQATFLAHDLLERLRSERGMNSPYLTHLPSSDWWQTLQTDLPGASAQLSQQAPNHFQVRITWQEEREEPRHLVLGANL